MPDATSKRSMGACAAWLVVCVLMLLAASGSRAQDAVAVPTDAVDAVERELKERLAAVTDDASLDAASREAALARLNEAQRALQAAGSSRLELNRLAEERVAAPALLAGLTASPGDDERASAEEWTALSLAQLEIAASEADNLTRAAREQLSETRKRLADLRNQRPLFGAELAAARDAASDAGVEVTRLAAISQAVQGADVERLVARARQLATVSRLALLQELRDGADTREQLLAAQVEAAAREVTRRDQRLHTLRAELARRRLAAAVADVSAWQKSAVGSNPAIGAMARANQELAELYGGTAGVTLQLEEVQRNLADTERTLAQVESDATELRARLAGLGRSFAAGVLLREGIESLPSPIDHRVRLEQLRVSINDTQLQIATLATALRRLDRDLPGEASAVVARLRDVPAGEEAVAREVVGNLLAARQRILRPLLRDLDQLLNARVELQAREQDLVASVQREARYLRSREPWTRNGRRVTWHHLPAAFGALVGLANPRIWAGDEATLARGPPAWRSTAAFALAGSLAAFGAAVLVQRRYRRPPGSDATRGQRNAAGWALLAALLGGVATLALVATVGWVLRGLPSGSVAVQALGDGLLQITPGFFLLGFLRVLFAEHEGIASAKPALAGTAARIRGSLGYLLATFVLLTASRVLDSLGAAGELANADPAARLCMLLAALLLAAGIHRAMSARVIARLREGGLTAATAAVATFVFAAMIPCVVAVLLLKGFTVGAFEVARTVLGTLIVLVVAGTVRVAFLAPDAVTDGSRGVPWSSLRQGRLDLLHVLVSIGAIVALLWVWRDAIAALRYLQDIPLWSTETLEGLKTVTVANLISSLTVLVATLVTFWALPLVFGVESAGAAPATVGTRYAAIALMRYVVLVVGLVSAFSLLNIGWSKLQWMAAGLSVGLGFGLQDTAANLFSGLTLLSERSVRVGDLVTVGDKTGVVKRIKLRATVVEDSDGREIVFPNKVLVTTQVTNWTLTNSKRRLQLGIGVAYGADTDLVVQTLLAAAREVAGVLAEPAPQVEFQQFGDHVLQFRLYVWIAAQQGAGRINHELHMAIERRFRTSGLAIDFAQRPHGQSEGRLGSDAAAASSPAGGSAGLTTGYPQHL